MRSNAAVHGVPCRCGKCGEDLVVSCPRGCDDAEASVRGEPVAAWVGKKEPAERAPGMIQRNQTRARVLDVLAGGVPRTARQIAEQMGGDEHIVALTARAEMMLRTLRAEHRVTRTMPPGRKHGYVWALGGRRAK